MKFYYCIVLILLLFTSCVENKRAGTHSSTDPITDPFSDNKKEYGFETKDLIIYEDVIDQDENLFYTRTYYWHFKTIRHTTLRFLIKNEPHIIRGKRCQVIYITG
ncbi:hypothetical protein JYT51_00200 [Candidatus Amoebophilus asiaticus]|nr:hypothetical protein [Candidatus Amoebophilus asiaticus]